MDMFVSALISLEIPSNIDSMQDLNGRGEIGIDAVRALLLVHNMTLSCHRTVQASVGLSQGKVLLAHFSIFCLLQPLFRSNGDRCSSPLTTTETAS